MDKNFLLNESKVFCILPWIHTMIMPSGDIYPCCVGVDAKSFGSINNDKLTNIINNDAYKKLRSNMLSENKTPVCNGCYEFEKYGSSFRKYNNETFEKFIDEVILNTNSDGSIKEFKMRYFDIRFKNICNFKCRTCGPDYSTSWAMEENKFENTKHKVFDIKTTSNILTQLLSNLDDVDMFYFAGGEPLITDEHYVILEELIKKKKTDITLRYNTNCSVLHYKNKDIFSLWKHFKSISVSASIDHIEERAEYIRSGTEWGLIDKNLKLLRDFPNVDLSINTVLSVFNYATLDILYEYLKNIQVFHPQSWYNSLINTTRPSYFSATVLPKNLKDLGTERINKLIERLSSEGYTSQLRLFNNAIEFANSKTDWETERESFLLQVDKKDKQRNESFIKTFPELSSMWSNQ